MKEFKCIKNLNTNTKLMIIQALVYTAGAFISNFRFDIIAAIIFLSLGIYAYIYVYSKTNNLIHPVGVFNLSWTAVIGLCCLKLSKLQFPWNYRTWITHVITILSFEVFYIYKFSHKFKKTHNKTKTTEFKLDSVKEKRIIISIVLLTIASLGGTVFEWIKCGFLPILSPKPHAYSYFHVSGVHYFTVLFVLVPCLVVVYLMRHMDSSNLIISFKNEKLINKIIIVLSLIISFVIPMVIVSRGQMIFMVLLATIAYLYLKPDIKIRYILIIIGFLIVLWIILSIFRHHSPEYLNKVFEFKNKNTPVFITQPYMYICNNFESLNFQINNYGHMPDLHHTFGLAMLFPLFALTGLKFKYPNLVVSRVFTMRGELTTVPIIYDAYYDFGMLGPVILMGAIAISLKYLNIKIKSSNNPIYICFYAQILMYLGLSFFTAWFSNPTTWFYFIVTYIVLRYVNYGIRFFRNSKT